MWKKDEVEPQTPAAPGLQQRAPRPEVPRSSGAPAERATIGRSITIKGEVTGDEDLLIQGTVDGSVNLKQHAVTVGGEGRVKANINARIVTVEGEVDGDLKALEQVVLRSSARVIGDLTAPRVVLEDGATFRGLVDMGDPTKEAGASQGSKAGSKEGPDAPKGSAETSGKTSPDATRTSPELALSSSDTRKDASGPTDKSKP
jgi:cytoskeletal protein CcmA (bactofilin family)